MRWLRAAIRLALLIPATALLYLLKVAGAPLKFFSRPAYLRWRDAMFSLWAHVITRLMGMRLNVSGTPPTRPFFLVANHLSYVDIILLARNLRAVFVAKAEIENWPLVGRLVSSVDTIFIDRERKRDVVAVNKEIGAALDAGEGVVLFAEGTSSDGATVLPLMPSLLEVPATREYPVCYAGITYATPAGEPAAAESVCWCGDDLFVPHLLRLLRVSRFDAHLHFGSTPVADTDRKLLAHKLRDAIMKERGDGQHAMHDNAKRFLKDNIAFLRQGIDLLRSIDDTLYQRTSPPRYESSAGAHIRHIYDHYRQLLDGLVGGHVDYDARDRNPRIESDKSFALDCLAKLSDELERTAIDGGRQITVRLNTSDSGRMSQSTVARELQFLISHTVHHYALIAFLLRHEGVAVPSGFGISPSTLEYQAARIRPAV